MNSKKLKRKKSFGKVNFVISVEKKVMWNFNVANRLMSNQKRGNNRQIEKLRIL